jgi:hypothetical protein
MLALTSTLTVSDSELRAQRSGWIPDGSHAEQPSEHNNADTFLSGPRTRVPHQQFSTT